MIDRKKRALEEKKLMLKSFMEGAKTEEEVITAKLDFDFVQNCLEISKFRSMLTFGKKKSISGVHEYYDLIEKLLEERIELDYELGLIPLKVIKMSEIKSLHYRFEIKHIIQKGKKNVKHTNVLSFYAKDEDEALGYFDKKIKKLGHDLLQIIEVNKKLNGVFLIDNSFKLNGTFTIENEA